MSKKAGQHRVARKMLLRGAEANGPSFIGQPETVPSRTERRAEKRARLKAEKRAKKAQE